MKKVHYIRFVSLFMLILMLGSLLSPAASAQKTALPQIENVDAFCVINTEYRQVVLEKNMSKTIYPASTVKLLTALVAEEHFRQNLNTKVSVTSQMLDAVVGRNMGLEEGEQIRIVDLLHAMLVSGYNDAAIILAFATSGSIEAFAQQMNQKAKELGASHSNYTNPTGLHDAAMVTTAYDTALIGLAVRENQTLFSITKTLKYTLPATNKSEDRTIYNRNPMISTSTTEEYYYSHAEGMSSGATDEGGDCVVTSGHIKSRLGADTEELPDELSFICVVMGGKATATGDDTNYACVGTKTLLRYALVNYELQKILSKDQRMGTVPVRFSPTEEEVNVKPQSDLYALLHIDVDVEKDIEVKISDLPELLEAPIPEGTKAGTVQVILDGTVIGTTDLITTASVDSHSFLIIMFYAKQITQHPVFIILLILAIGCLVYFLLKRFPIIKNKDRHKRTRYF